MELFIMENPIKMEDLGVPPFKETPIYHTWMPWVRSHYQVTTKSRLQRPKTRGITWTPQKNPPQKTRLTSAGMTGRLGIMNNNPYNQIGSFVQPPPQMMVYLYIYIWILWNMGISPGSGLVAIIWSTSMFVQGGPVTSYKWNYNTYSL